MKMKMKMMVVKMMMMLTMLFPAAGSLHPGASSLHCHRVHVQVCFHFTKASDQDYVNAIQLIMVMSMIANIQ